MDVDPANLRKLMEAVSVQAERDSELLSRCTRLQETKDEWQKGMDYQTHEDQWVRERLAVLRQQPVATQEEKQMQATSLQSQKTYQAMLAKCDRCLRFNHLLVQLGTEDEEGEASGCPSAIIKHIGTGPPISCRINACQQSWCRSLVSQ